VLLKALQKLWPLAKSSVHENALDGTVEAEIVVPRERDERKRAKNKARNSRLSEFLLALSMAMMAIALAMYVNDCYMALNSANAAGDPGAEAKSEL